MTAPKSSSKALKSKAIRHSDQTLAQRVGQSIARYRKLAGVTQAKAASQLGIETETVSRLETGAISATLDRLEQFADLYGCPVASFFHEETEEVDGTAKTLSGILRPLTDEERRLVVNFVAQAGRLFRRRREKGVAE